MALVLHRFPLSHFSEKVRAAMDFKGLEYELVDHAAGPDQLALYRLSGQRKAPVLVHDGEAITDSTAIALHLDRAFPVGAGRRALLPGEISKRRAALELTGRIDDVFGEHTPMLALDAAAHDSELFVELARVTLNVDGVALKAARGISLASRVALALPSGRRALEASRSAVDALLVELGERLERTPFLLGDEPTLADVSAAAMAFYLRFPVSRHLARPSLAGRGVERVFGDPRHRRFFAWREAFYRELLR